jgi:hypothetical protein
MRKIAKIVLQPNGKMITQYEILEMKKPCTVFRSKETAEWVRFDCEWSSRQPAHPCGQLETINRQAIRWQLSLIRQPHLLSKWHLF